MTTLATTPARSATSNSSTSELFEKFNNSFIYYDLIKLHLKVCPQTQALAFQINLINST